MILPTHIVAAGGLIMNDKNEILLVKNPRKGWEYPGGIIESGETLPFLVLLKVYIFTSSGYLLQVLFCN